MNKPIDTNRLSDIAFYLHGLEDGKGDLSPMGRMDLDELWRAIYFLRGDGVGEDEQVRLIADHYMMDPEEEDASPVPEDQNWQSWLLDVISIIAKEPHMSFSSKDINEFETLLHLVINKERRSLLRSLIYALKSYGPTRPDGLTEQEHIEGIERGNGFKPFKVSPPDQSEDIPDIDIHKGLFHQFRRTTLSELRPIRKSEVDAGPDALISLGVSISEEDRKKGSPKSGDWIARNPENRNDMWLIEQEYFRRNYKRASKPTKSRSPVEAVLDEPTDLEQEFSYRNGANKHYMIRLAKVLAQDEEPVGDRWVRHDEKVIFDLLKSLRDRKGPNITMGIKEAISGYLALTETTDHNMAVTPSNLGTELEVIQYWGSNRQYTDEYFLTLLIELLTLDPNKKKGATLFFGDFRASLERLVSTDGSAMMGIINAVRDYAKKKGLVK